MKAQRRVRPSVESLEGKNLLSAGLSPASAAHGVAASAVHASRASAHLLGQLNLTATNTFSNPDVGHNTQVNGSGQVRPLGSVNAQGSFHAVGFIRRGHATGTLTLANANGSVTLQLVGPPQPGFSQLPSSFTYHITQGTGSYQGLSGSGTATLTPAAGNASGYTLTFRR